MRRMTEWLQMGHFFPKIQNLKPTSQYPKKPTLEPDQFLASRHSLVARVEGENVVNVAVWESDVVRHVRARSDGRLIKQGAHVLLAVHGRRMKVTSDSGPCTAYLFTELRCASSIACSVASFTSRP